MNDKERVLERLNYDIEELELEKFDCLLNLCSLGEKVEKIQSKILKVEKRPTTATMIVDLAEATYKFDEAKEIYNDLANDIIALSNHIKAIKQIAIKEAILMIA